MSRSYLIAGWGLLTGVLEIIGALLFLAALRFRRGHAALLTQAAT